MSKLTPLQATAPRKIFLQIDDHEGGHDEPFPDDTEGVTWCAEPAQACEVAYVREDLAPAHAGGAEAVAQPKHTLDDDYAHFLSYSGLTDAPLLRYAYFHGADAECELPEVQPAEAWRVRGSFTELFTDLEEAHKYAMAIRAEVVPLYSAPTAQPQPTSDRIERLKFDLRQHMIDYGQAVSRGNDEAILTTTTAGCAAIDELASIAASQPQPERYVSALDPAMQAIKAQPDPQRLVKCPPCESGCRGKCKREPELSPSGRFPGGYIGWPALRVARITLDGTTLTVPADQLTALGLGDDDNETYTLTFATMTQDAYEALGEFDGF